MSHAQLTLLRHGKSVWNKENRFTGWVDVALAEEGRQEVRAAAAAILEQGLSFDAAFVSSLRRAISSLWLVLEEMDIQWVPQVSDWRLNERHYGALQGLDKNEVIAQYGAEQVQQWRRGFAVPLPPLTTAQPLLAGREPPTGESLQDIVPRVAAVYHDSIVPLLAEGKRVLVVAHGNSLRALIRLIEQISDEDIMAVEVGTATPWVYALDSRLQILNRKIITR